MKKYTIIFILILAIFSMSHEAFADTYEHLCNDGKKVISNISITPPGPFSTNQSTNFQAKGWIKSECSARKIKMTLKHNGGTELTIIEEDTVGPTLQYPAIIPSKNFQSPTIAGKGYKVSFKTSVEEPTAPPQGTIIYSSLFSENTAGVCTKAQALTHYVAPPNTTIVVGSRVYYDQNLTLSVAGAKYVSIDNLSTGVPDKVFSFQTGTNIVETELGTNAINGCNN